MPAATVVAKYVNPPQAGKKQGSIKTPDGVFYGVPPAMLAQFQEGGTYNVNYEDRIWNGKTYHTVTGINAVESAPPASSAARSTGKYGSTDDATAERIFVCGALNSFITAGKIEPTQIAVVGAVKALRGAWGDTFGQPKVQAKTQATTFVGGTQAPPPQQQGPQTTDDMNDQIPF